MQINKKRQRPIIAIPMGDPAGIGPEIVVKALCCKKVAFLARCLVIGDEKILKKAIAVTKSNIKIQNVFEQDLLNNSNNIFKGKKKLFLLDLNNVDLSQYEFGKISGMCGRAAYEYIKKATELVLSGKITAIATPPINKEALKLGNIPFIGHTEIFAKLTNTSDPLTLFEVHGMRVFFLSRHVSLKKACELVKKERIKDYVKRCSEVLKKLGVSSGTMAIAGLNPHSGEHGLFGDEEDSEIVPAVKELVAEGFAVEGPVSADSVFHQALQGKYNSVLSLYHDQGHIATKTLDFERTIAITGGLPFLRTSVDHGTAMDIAGTGKASDVSMVEAILLAVKYSQT